MSFLRHCCNSSYFYIKPQRMTWCGARIRVVIHPISTSNHNILIEYQNTTAVVIHPISTSNHNIEVVSPVRCAVVIHPISTSNHNRQWRHFERPFVVIHPISTSNHNLQVTFDDGTKGCNSSYFYIKPQPCPSRCLRSGVVIHPISTSNHNLV